MQMNQAIIKGASLSKDELLTLLDKLKGLSLKPKEKTVFSIGGRGHYENPISDVLAFFLDPNEVHELGPLVAQAMLSCAGIDASPHSIRAIHREYVTNEQTRLDLVLVGDDWLLAIENKVYHTANNPFKHYQEHLEKEFTEKKDKLKLILLSPKNDKAEGWQSVSFTELAQAIQAGMAEQVLELPFNKWHFFLRDFLTNLKSLSGADAMDDTTFELLQENMSDIYKLEKIKETFNEEVKQRGLKLLEERIGKEFTVKMQKWASDVLAYRFKCDEWHHESEVVLVVGYGAKRSHKLRIYVDGPVLNKLNGVLKGAGYKYENKGESNDRWDCYFLDKNYSSITKGLEELSKVAKLVDDWHVATGRIIAK